VANALNYGDDVTAQDLINPPAFSDFGLQPTALNELKTKEFLFALFDRIGYTLRDDIQEKLFLKASKSCNYNPNLCTINAYRDELNRFLIAENVADKK